MKLFVVCCAVLLALVAQATARPPQGDQGDLTREDVPSAADAPEVPPHLQLLYAEAEAPLVRERRSTQPGQGQGHPGQQGQQGQQGRGGVDVFVHRERGVGTVVSARGEGNVWTSRDGSARVDAHGNWERVVRGPARSRPQYGGGVTFSKRW